MWYNRKKFEIITEVTFFILYTMDYLCRWLPILLLLCISTGGHAETDELRAEASRTYQSIEIDGELSESDWQNATPIRQFTQFEPDAGEPLTESTEVRILYDGKYIYFGFVCSEPERAKIVANKMRRDSMLYDQRQCLRDVGHL